VNNFYEKALCKTENISPRPSPPEEERGKKQQWRGIGHYYKQATPTAFLAQQSHERLKLWAFLHLIRAS
jgi:hypothetical protein